MSAPESKATASSPATSDPTKRIAELEKSVSSLNTKLTIAAIVGVLLGSGGIFGLIKISSEVKATEINTVVTIQKQKIESLERSLKRLEDGGAATDSKEVTELKQRVEKAEEQLRKALEGFDSTTRALAKDFEVLRDSANSLAKATSDNAKINAEFQERLKSLNKSLEQQAAAVSEVKKEHSEFIKQARKKFDF